MGRDLTVSSVPDTGKVSGKEYDASLTVTVGYGASVSGSVGFGETTGNKDWVGNQTSVIARDKLDIRTEDHTQIDGAIIASQTGNLKLDTDTLGFRDIQGEDKEHGYYLNAGGTYGTGGQQDSSQVGKGESGVSGWSAEGYDYNKEKEQIVRATVGAGEIVVRNDATTGADSTEGLNRDISKSYEITKDEEDRTDIYVSKSSIDAASNPEATVKAWANAAKNYDKTVIANYKELGALANTLMYGIEKLSGTQPPAAAVEAGGLEIAEQAFYGLVRGGKSTKEAEAILASKQFQIAVLEQMKGIVDLYNAHPEVVIDAVTGLAEKNIIVTYKGATKSQQVLAKVSSINAYIKENPAQAEAVGYVLAAAQGPKGLILLAAQKALGETSFAKAMAEFQEDLQNELGGKIANGMEGTVLNPKEDSYLLGGGSLIAGLVIGATVGVAASKVITVVKRESVKPSETNHNSDSAQTDAEVGNLPSSQGINNNKLFEELSSNGVKFTPENVVAVGRSPSGQVVFLETGTSKAGLQHIVKEHAGEFAQMGVAESQIASVVMRAVTEGKIVGHQGAGSGRPIYEVMVNGKLQKIAVTVGSNGYIVGANPRGSM